MKNLYMIVTADEYELPILVSDHVIDLAKFMNVSINDVYSSISKGLSGKGTGYKYVKVPMEGDQIV